MHVPVTAVSTHVPRLCLGDVVDAAADAFQLNGFAGHRRANIVDIAQRTQIQPAARVDKPGVKVIQAVATVDGETVLRQQRAAAVGDVAARQLHVIAANHAAALHRHVFWRQIYFWHHYGLTVNGRGFIPQDAVVERSNLIGCQRHAKLQTEGDLRTGGVIHQVAHLIEV